MLRARIQRVLSPFNRGHAMFMGSSALVMLFPLISAPVVARLYSPHDFGVYAVFYSLATILSSISSLELKNIVLLEIERVDGFHGAILAILVVFLFSLSLGLIIYVFPIAWSVQLFGEAVHPYLRWLPITVFLLGSSQVTYSWAVREKEFNFLARNKFVLGGITVVFQIGVGLLEPGAIGFIVANLLGLLISAYFLFQLFSRSMYLIRSRFSMRSARMQMRLHYRLTVWTAPSTLLNSFSQFLPDFLINRFFGAALLGQYSLAVRVLNMPIAFLSSSIQEFFRQMASEESNVVGRCRATFWRFFAITLAGGIFLILPVIVLIPYIFPIIFGVQWSESGTLIQGISLLTIVRFISSPLSYIWIIQGQQRLDFFWQIGLLGLSLGALILPPILEPQITLYTTLWIYSLVVGSWYVLAIAISYHLSGLQRRQSVAMPTE